MFYPIATLRRWITIYKRNVIKICGAAAKRCLPILKSFYLSICFEKLIIQKKIK